MLPIYTNDPVFVSNTTNGKLYKADSVNPPIWVAHLYGTPYQMGYAQGVMLQSQIVSLYNQSFDWMYNQINEHLPSLPTWLQHYIDVYGVAAALDLEYKLCEPYIPERFIQEMQGLSDGSGVPYKQIAQMHMLPELIKASCSMIGTWGPAISASGGTLHTLRALDWNTNGPFQEFPALLVYHPEEGNGNPFAMLSWTGWIGALTGFSSSPVSIHEKVWETPVGNDHRAGIPFTFMLRDILQFDIDIDSAITRMANAERTCSIYVGVGSGLQKQFVAVEYQHENITVGDPYNIPAWSDHPSLQSSVYIDKHPQPSSDPCLGDLMQQYYGSLDALHFVQYLAPLHETGDMHLAAADFANNYYYVSNASPVINNNASAVIPAYNRPPVRFDMLSLFSESLN